ncbi:Flap endonuclease 1 [Cucumispora dikerogammari]|nr:Flap endonuclease 1 [Cucumispora dikerogammari]
MGIKNLSKILNKYSPPIKRNLSHFTNRTVAIDAPMTLYQCLIAIRSTQTPLESSTFENAHLIGLYYKLIKYIENKINIIFIFDGKPPAEKSKELENRKEKRIKASEIQNYALEIGDINLYKQMEKRQVRIERKHIIESIKLFKLMGVQYFIAPGEAEAFSVLLYKKGIVDCIYSEDMDVITYGGKLIRNLNSGNEKKKPILEYDFKKILIDLGLENQQFIDLCILLGCDYTGTLSGIGVSKSFSLIKEFKSIENILANNKFSNDVIKEGVINNDDILGDEENDSFQGDGDGLEESSDNLDCKKHVRSGSQEGNTLMSQEGNTLKVQEGKSLENQGGNILENQEGNILESQKDNTLESQKDNILEKQKENTLENENEYENKKDKMLKNEKKFEYEKARKIFENKISTETLEILPTIKTKYTKPDFDGLIEFLCAEKGFNEEKIRKGIERIQSARKNNRQKQITDFLLRK